MSGVLYVAATPIGNLNDASARLREVLASAGTILAEDTRRSGRLLQQFGLKKPLLALHDHNESAASEPLVARMLAGETFALISDAGTPAISDPGYHLIRAARTACVAVVPIPGPSAVIAALSACGLPTDRFCFEGFLPAKSVARRSALTTLAAETRTMVLFESVHRVEDCLRDCVDLIGEMRDAAIARELTKLHEQIVTGTLASLLQQVATGGIPLKGEFVLIIAGAPETDGSSDEGQRLLASLLDAGIPLKEAARAAADVTGARRNALYQFGLTLKSAG
ncbi:MAG: 16S rRNA (cytidine(1402)-2'-O)-methyltransferase [Pseudomonadota bacterium]